LTVAAAAVTIMGAAGASAAIATEGAATRPTTEHFSFVSTRSNGAYSVIGSGAFTDGGVAQVLDGRATLWLRKGKVRATIRSGKVSRRVNPTTCLGVVRQAGTYRIVGGTGAYTGITGTGRYMARYSELGQIRKGTCARAANPVAVQFVITGGGPVAGERR
jgi:hypothetical protein